MSTTKTVQISQTNSGVLAAELNAAITGGRDVTLNGDTPVAGHRGSEPVRAYLNGTLSYLVPAKKPGATREVFVKIGHMLTVTSEAPADQEPAPHAVVKPTTSKRKQGTPRPSVTVTIAKNGKAPIPATVKGETGWLSVRTVDGKYRYAVTMDEKNATLFAPGGSTTRHAARAEKAGIKVAV